MNNLFKKSLIATAVLGFSSASFAAELFIDTNGNSDAIVVTNEYLAAEPTVELGAGQDLLFVLGANYTENDIVELTFTGEGLDPASLPATASADDGLVPAVDSVVFGLISTSVVGGNTVATYRVTNVTGDTDNLEIALDGLEFDTAGVAASGGVTVSFAAETNTGLALDTAGGDARSIELIELVDQFSITTDDFDAVIDVNKARLEFAPDDVDVGELTLDVATADFSATKGETSYSLVDGNFGYLLDEDGELLNVGSVAVACVGGAVVADTTVITTTTISADCNAATTGFTVTFDNADNTVAIPTQDFSYEASVAYTGTTDGSTDLSGAVGEWTLNGSEIQVSYIPYRSNISQVINVINRSGLAGGVSVTALPEAGGSAIDLGEIATVPAGGMVRIAGPLLNALSDATGVDHSTVGSTTRYALTIVTNAPSGDIEVYSAYNVGGTGARLVVNDSNGATVEQN